MATKQESLKDIITQDADIKRLVASISREGSSRKRKLLAQELFDRLTDLEPSNNNERVVQVFLGILTKLKIDVEEQQDILLELDINNEDRFLIIKKSSLSKMFEKMQQSIKLDIPTPQVTVKAPDVKVDTPRFNIPAPVVNVPTSPTPIVNVDMDVIVDALENLEESLGILGINSVENPLAVRMSDGEEWVDRIKTSLDGLQQSFGSFQGHIGLKDKSGNTVNPATDDSPKTIVSGTKTVTTAGTAVQITTSSVSCKEVLVSADLGNTNPVVVGDSNVVAANNSQQGVVLVPGTTPLRLKVSDLNLLWVDSQTDGDKLCYAYLS